MQRRHFGKAGDTDIEEITLEHAGGARACILTYGATVRDLIVPLPGGGRQRVVLGMETLEHYRDHASHFGAIAGRYANRIGHGRFTLDGKACQLPLNQAGKHSLHGGGDGFGKRPWTLLHADAASVTLGLVSPDGDHGYPGTLTVTCRYTLAPSGTLAIALDAFTDQPTVLNLCHHSYFNLDGGANILDHDLMIRANVMTPVDADLVPDGSLAPVSGTPFDFRKPRPIRLANPDGTRFWYDHNFMLRRDRTEHTADGVELAHAATLSSRRTGLAMEVWTSEPAMQVYDAEKMNVPVAGLGGARYGSCAGLAMEPQHVPDSPNLPHFPSTILRPGMLYRQRTEYRF